MKMEYVTNRALLAAYLAVEYKDKETLVIYLDSDCSQQEFDTLMKELDEMGYLPPRGWVLVSGYIVIEMPWGLACKVIAAHNNRIQPSSQYDYSPNRTCQHQFQTES